METRDLIQNSRQLCQTAESILVNAKMDEFFSPLGKVEVIGSLRLKLMYRFDIDLLVISEEIKKDKAEEVTKKFKDLGIFHSIILKDYQSNPEFDMPLGFYWELVLFEKEQKWKFDIWYLKPDERYVGLVSSSINKFEALLKKNPEKGELILQLKEAYFDGSKYKDNIKSMDIYTAALEKGIDSVEMFEAQKTDLIQYY